MKLRLYSTFAKRKNSTKQPSINFQYKEYEVFLKVDTDYDNPTFEIRDAVQLFPIYTYAYLVDIDRYYFIASVKQRNANCWEIICELDELATYKSVIQSTSAYVVYSSTDYSLLIPDERINMLSDCVDYVDDSAESIFTDTPKYLLSIVGKTGIHTLIPVDPNHLPATLYSASESDLVDALCIQWSDAQCCMLNLREVPVDVASTYSADAYIGKWHIGSTPALSYFANGYKVESKKAIEIPATYNDFRLYKFVEAHLYLPNVGVIQIDLQDYIPDPTVDEGRNIHIHTVANVETGQLSYSLSNDYGDLIATYTGAFGRSIPLNASTSRDIIGGITSVIAGAAAVASGLPAAAKAAGILAASNSFGDALHGKHSTIGSFNGGYGELLGTNFVLTVQKHLSNIEPENLRAIEGLPCAKVRSLSGLSGYVQTSGASVAVNANSNVIDKLNAALDAGIYIE